MREATQIRTKTDFWSISLPLCAAYVSFCALFFPERTASSVSFALTLCIKAVIPALAAFIISYKIMAPAMVAAFAKIRAPQKLFHVSAGGMCMIFSGMFSGFPMGAVIYSELRRAESISEEEGRALMPYSNNAGAAFLIGSAGAKMFGDTALGITLFIIQSASVFIILLLTRKKRNFNCAPISPKSEKITPSSAARAIGGGGATMLGIVCFIVFFSVLGDAVISDLRLGDTAGAAVRCIFEISGGINALSSLGAAGRAFSGFAVGFAGISVYMQAHFAAGGEAMENFLAGRLALSALCGGFTLVCELTSKTVALSIVGATTVLSFCAALFCDIAKKKTAEKSSAKR